MKTSCCESVSVGTQLVPLGNHPAFPPSHADVPCGAFPFCICNKLWGWERTRQMRNVSNVIVPREIGRAHV